MSFKQQGETEKQPAPFTLERDLKMITEEFKPLPRHSGMIRVNKILPVRNSISSKEDVNAFNKDCKDVIFKKMQIKKNSLPTLNKIEFPKPDKTFNHSPTQIKESSTKSNIATKTSNIILTTNYSEKEGVDKHEEGQLDSSNVILNSIQKLGKMLQGTNLKDTIIIDDDGNNNLNLIQNTHNNKNETYIEINNLLKNHDCNNETNDESEQRMKRYGILFDFINSNLKEINLLMSNEKEKDVIKKSSPFMDNPDITDSFLESCINEEFYRNLAEQTNHLDYNELSSIMSKIDATHINNKSDTTQFQFDGMHFNRRNARNRDRPNEDMFDGNITCEYVDTENEFTGTKL